MQAIVLSRQDFKEYDQIISLYTREQGRRDVLARGIKKIVSKNAAHLEPCSFVEVGTAKGKEMDIVTNVQTENYFLGVRKNYVKSLYGLWAMEKIKIFFSSPEKDEKVFFFLGSWLQALNTQKEISPYLLDGFVLRSLFYLGFIPVFDHCVECERKRSGTRFSFSPLRGGIICMNCVRQMQLKKESLILISLSFIGMCESLLYDPFEKFFEYTREKKEYKKVHKFVFLFLLSHQEGMIKDWLKLGKLSDFLI